jgi:membrane protease YdiL (CAAX protease family)
MSNVLGAMQTEMPPVVVWVGLAWLTLAVLVAKACGAFGRRSIAGPERIAQGESGWTLAIIFFLGLSAAMPVGTLVARFCKARNVDANLQLLIGGICTEATAFLLWVVISAISRPQGVDRLGLKLRRLPGGVLLGLLTLFVLYPVVLVVSQMTSVALQWAGGREPKPNQVLEIVTTSHQHGVIVLGVIMAVAVAPLFEELAFRGFLQTVLGRLFNWSGRPGVAARWAAVIITSVCFALVHGEKAFMPPLFVLALGLGYLYERTGNLWGNIVVHAVFNGLQIFLALSMGMN